MAKIFQIDIENGPNRLKDMSLVLRNLNIQINQCNAIVHVQKWKKSALPNQYYYI